MGLGVAEAGGGLDLESGDGGGVGGARLGDDAEVDLPGWCGHVCYGFGLDLVCMACRYCWLRREREGVGDIIKCLMPCEIFTEYLVASWEVGRFGLFGVTYYVRTMGLLHA